jgi:hypothetical protein
MTNEKGKNMIKKNSITLVVLMRLSCALYAYNTSFACDPVIPTITFAANHLTDALTEQNFTVTHVKLSRLTTVHSPVRIIMTTHNYPAAQTILHHLGIEAIPALDDEGYSLRVENGAGIVTYWIFGGDLRRAMYGGLDLAEAIQGEGNNNL